MKKILCTVISFFVVAQLFQNANAQDWSLSGNSNATTGSKLGTTNAIPLRLYTKNSERIRIDTAGRVGIGTTAPTDRLHVNSAAGNNPLRIQVNGNTKLLVHSGGGIAVGANSTPPANGLYVAGKVGIGITNPSARLHIVGTNPDSNALQIDNGRIVVDLGSESGENSIGISSVAPNGTGVYGGAGEGFGVLGNGIVGVKGAGVRGVVGESLFGGGSGVEGDADDGDGVYGESQTGYGVRGFSYKSNGIYGESAQSNGTGVYGKSYNGVYGLTDIAGGQGVYGTASGLNAWGVRGYSASSFGVYGSTGNSSSYAGYFNGRVYTTATYQTSDRSLKQDIADVTSAIDIIGKLKPKTYSFKQDGAFKLMNLPQGKHYGLIAQEVEQVLPELVNATTFDAGKAAADADPKQAVTSKEISFKVLNYTELIPIVVKAVQEQQEQIKKQQQENDDLRARIETLEALIRGGSGTTISVASLSVATPNPVKGSARIGYTVPSNSRAQLIFTDATGKTVKVISLTGSGYTNLNTAGLSSGTYNYSLIVDGKNVDTKKLIIAR